MILLHMQRNTKRLPILFMLCATILSLHIAYHPQIIQHTYSIEESQSIFVTDVADPIKISGVIIDNPSKPTKYFIGTITAFGTESVFPWYKKLSFMRPTENWPYGTAILTREAFHQGKEIVCTLNADSEVNMKLWFSLENIEFSYKVGTENRMISLRVKQ